MFADRTGWRLTPNLLSQRLTALHRRGVSILDLTESNPTQVGIRYPEEILGFLADPGSLTYEPSPKGLLLARQAVAGVYAEKGISLEPDQLLLTASTSEAYSFLFKLLCNPGDSILVPKPSYPLFEYLADLNDVELSAYRLRCDQRWGIDFGSLGRAISARTRGIVAVHPNNPTGSGLTLEETSQLASLCRQKKAALIVDEVFADYWHDPNPGIPRTLAGNPDLLTFCLGGLSKFLALPQMKLAWMAVTGPADLLHPAMERLEMIADTYLSVNTPVQRAVPQWLANAPAIQSQIRRRILENRKALLEQIDPAGSSAQCLQADGGWNAVLRLPAIRDEEAFVLDLLEREHLLVHPGYFFDFEEPGHLVLSLLPLPEIFREGIQRLFATIGA
ncbi:MAG: pyridoxal phosphate-dependent aminotransferase [Candidatus Omnitrophica bacterium]|nr:pyridoxal phosphate-dependent aminotransferase [Candidatus Omnitrophota bacterium]